MPSRPFRPEPSLVRVRPAPPAGLTPLLLFCSSGKGGCPVRTTRLEAFSDGVLAIIITIMVLELAVPEGHDLSALVHTTGVGLLSYLLSFAYVGIYWNNHHHMFRLV